MTDGYEINVSLNGKHFFATALRSAPTERKMKELYEVFEKKFPEPEGYKIMVSCLESVWRHIEFN